MSEGERYGQKQGLHRILLAMAPSLKVLHAYVGMVSAAAECKDFNHVTSIVSECDVIVENHCNFFCDQLMLCRGSSLE